MLFNKEGSPMQGGRPEGQGGPRHHHHAEGQGPVGPGGHGPFGGHRGPGFGGPGRGFGGRGRVTRRGDVRASIMALLGEKPMHGYQVISELEARTEGRWRPSAGSIYPTLQQLEDEGLVRSEEIDGRRVFSLTEAGAAQTARQGDGGGAPWQSDVTADDDPAFTLRRLTFQVGAAAMQVVEVGSPRSIEQAQEILTDARRRLYRLLADDETPGAPTSDQEPQPGR